MYKCECGKEFDNPQKFNGHKSHCRIHLGDDKYFKRNFEQTKSMARIKADKQKQLSEVKRRIADDIWVSEKHRCEHCVKIMIEKWGSGRFCCRSCANSRRQTPEVNEKRKESYLKTMITKQTEPEAVIKNRFKSGYYKGMYCSSSYELMYVIYCEKHDIEVKRCPYRFKYKYKNNYRIYVPDFYLPESNTIVEIKGHGLFYDKNLVLAKSKAVRQSNYNFKIIHEKEFNRKYLTWIKKHYNLRSSWKSYSYFCDSMYDKPTGPAR